MKDLGDSTFEDSIISQTYPIKREMLAGHESLIKNVRHIVPKLEKITIHNKFWLKSQGNLNLLILKKFH